MVSVIIVTRNINGKLLKCLDSVKAQTYKDIEVILETEGSIQQARKRGIAKAQGEYIALVDDDQVLPPNLIKECLNCCELGYDGVTWTERGLSPTTFMGKVIDYDKWLFHSLEDDDPINGAAEPRFFKSHFLKLLDFSKLPPVTFELSMINKQVNAMGAKIGFIKIIVHHHEPKNTIELFKKFYRYGYYYLPSLAYDRELVLCHSKPRRAYFSPRALKNPVLYLGLWYHYFVKAFAAGLGTLAYYFR